MSTYPAARRARPLALIYCTLLPLSIACSPDTVTAPPGIEPPIRGNAIEGRIAFEAECASCHAARDGLDLAFFGFPDTTIIRRAVAHVDSSTAHDIVAHIATIRVAPTSREFRLFQPGGMQAAGDVDFAVRLFGSDAWPVQLTSEALEAVDPRDVAIALPMPLWSFEFSNLDWMPGTPIDDALLDHPTEVGVARAHLASYYATRSEEDLLRAVVALRIAEREPANSNAPCVMDPIDQLRPVECFEVRRWISTLVAQHMMRSGETEPIHSALHDEWWDVGNVSRRSRQIGQPLDNAVQNWAVWMYLGWAFDPARHASVYLGNAFTLLGMPRQATFHALRAQVSRGRRSLAAYHDAHNAARFSPVHWAFDATRFGLEELLGRLQAGLRPGSAEALAEARVTMDRAYTAAARKVTPSEAAELAALRDQIVSLLN
jgi:hypothetical protein